MNTSFLESNFTNSLRYVMNNSSDLQNDGTYGVTKEWTILAISYAFNLTDPVNKILELRYGPGGVGHKLQSVLGGMATVRNNYLLK